jgi:hypothetical protein
MRPQAELPATIAPVDSADAGAADHQELALGVLEDALRRP